MSKVATILDAMDEIECEIVAALRKKADLHSQLSDLGWDTIILVRLLHDLRTGKLSPEVDAGTLYLARLQERELAKSPREYAARGFVYFIRFDRTKRLKIGYTTKLGERLRTIENTNGERGSLCALLIGSTSLEAKAHNHFRRWRLKGEWFDHTSECAAHVEQFRLEHGPQIESLQGKLIASVVGTA